MPGAPRANVPASLPESYLFIGQQTVLCINDGNALGYADMERPLRVTRTMAIREVLKRAYAPHGGTPNRYSSLALRKWKAWGPICRGHNARSQWGLPRCTANRGGLRVVIFGSKFNPRYPEEAPVLFTVLSTRS